MNIKTIEEKAKAYDEALKRAEAAIDIAADKDLVKGVAITIFPELKESEDEGIRKDLIKYLKSCRDSLPCEDVSFYDSSIAWLEKQKAVENPKKGCPTYPLSAVGDLLAKMPPAPIRFEQEQKPVDLEKEIRKHTDLFHADIEYPLRLTAIKFYELGRTEGIKGNLEEIPSNVDLEKEITAYIEKHFHIRYDETLEVGNDPLTTIDFCEAARHFYELGRNSK